MNFFAPAMTVSSATLNTNAVSGQNAGGSGFVTNQITISTALTINDNGNGPYPTGVNFGFTPVGSWNVNAPDYGLGDPITYAAFSGSSNPLTITGAGSMTINASGTGNGQKIWGYPLTINPASFTVNKAGSANSFTMDSWNGGTGYSTVTLGGTIAVHVNTNGTGQTTAYTRIGGTSVLPNPLMGNVLLDASGTNGGDGGTVAVTPNAGNISLGGTGSNITLKANGSSTGGNAGTINAGNGGSLAITVNNANALQASALAGSSSNGGTININGKSLTNAGGSSEAVAANGFGNGNGGTVNFQLATGTSGALTFGSAAAGFTVNANAATSGSGNGGTVSVNAGNITVTSPVATPAISVIAGNTNGKGGKITVNGSTISMSGGLSATGTGTAPGGVITIDSTGNLTFSGTAAVALNASGNATGASTDTAINVTAHEAITIGTATGDAQLTASGSGTSGNGGNVSVTTTSGAITATGSAINVVPGSSSGNWGTISLNAKTTPTVSGTLNANGMGTGNGGTINITGGSSVTVTGSQINVSAGTSGNGAGGKISIDGTSIALTGNLTATAATGGTGKGGVIDLTTTTGNLTFSNGGSQSVLNVSGNASGMGNDTAINISAHNAVTVGTATGDVQLIASNPSTSGNGGSVSITSTNGAITANGSQINVSAGTGSGGSGNTADIVLIADGTLTVTGTLDASGGTGTANGGTITITESGTSQQVNLSGATLTASAGSSTSGNGIGGIIVINSQNADDTITTNNTVLQANGRGSGGGGSISLNNNESSVVSATISATGGDTGKGGMASISDINNSDDIDVNKVINVSAGIDVTNTSTFDGSITLNQIPCTQILTGNTWPSSYWDCVSPELAIDSVPADQALTLSDNVLAQVNVIDTPIQLYVFANASNGTTFFSSLSQPAGAAGSTTVGPNSSTIIYSSLYETAGTTLTYTQLKEATTHELGHAIDHGSTPVNPSQSLPENQLATNPYGQYVQNDFFYLDYTSWPTGGDPGVAYYRTACGTGGFLVGFTDPTSSPLQQFCGSGTGYTGGIETKFYQRRLSYILQYSTDTAQVSYIFSYQGANPQNFNYTGGWSELYAQTYAFDAYVKPSMISISTTLRPLENTIFNSGYFACSQDWADALANSFGQPPSPTPQLPVGMSGTCTTPVPMWYANVIGK